MMTEIYQNCCFQISYSQSIELQNVICVKVNVGVETNGY